MHKTKQNESNWKQYKNPRVNVSIFKPKPRSLDKPKANIQIESFLQAKAKSRDGRRWYFIPE